MRGLDLYDTDVRGGSADRERPYVGILFECCGVYSRVYRSPGAPAYAGCCPKCRKPVRLAIGPGGTRARLFVAR